MQRLLTIARLKKAGVIPDGKHLLVELYCKYVKFSTTVSIEFHVLNSGSIQLVEKSRSLIRESRFFTSTGWSDPHSDFLCSSASRMY